MNYKFESDGMNEWSIEKTEEEAAIYENKIIHRSFTDAKEYGLMLLRMRRDLLNEAIKDLKKFKKKDL